MENLILLRELSGLRQIDVAEKIGVSRQAYCSYENDKREADYTTLCKLADFFGVSVDYLLGRENKNALSERADNNLAENYIKEYKELFQDPSFCQFSKVYKNIERDMRIRAVAYVLGFLENSGVKIREILG